MSSQPVGPSYYADFSGLEGLKRNVKADDPQAIRAAAQQFESLFTSMMLKSMREAKLGDSLGESQESDLYQEMYDQQIALKMSQGKGLGLADMLVQQLTRNRAAKAADATATATPATPAAAQSGATEAGSAAQAPSNAERIGFVKALAPYAEQAAAQLGVSSDTLIAQAALETGWGQHMPSTTGGGSSQNLFGIKAGANWSGAVVNASTTEYSGGSGRSVTQPFRSYDTLQQGVDDYVALLRNSARYQPALGTGDDVNAFAGALARGGYATDPVYVQKLHATVASVKALRGAGGADALKISTAQPIASAGESS